ncbi:MAG: tyrosine-protein phosphatase [Halioglobus sp.]|nr:tyrosine-protein phosphatase [Halioglobus sp.]
MLIPDAVHIWREPDGEYHVEWQASRPGTEVTVEALAEQGPLEAECRVEPGKIRLTGLPVGRHTFRLCDQHGTEVVAGERRLGMQGTPNFRDFGGYRTADGRHVKWGYLFRSGQLSGLSDQDVKLLASLRLDLVCDFRRTEEQQSDPSRLPATGAPRTASLPIVPGSNARFFEEVGQQTGDARKMYDFMLEINRDFAASQNATYARMFGEILDLDEARFLVHCAAGKDRTGFAAAIILLALGVPREVVLADYMLTRRFFDPAREVDRLKRKYQMDHMDTDAILPMLEVHEAYLARALATIDEGYASVEEYLREALGVGVAERRELRRRYLE